MKNPRQTALSVLNRILNGGGFSNLALNDALKNAELDSRDSAFAAALVYGTVERRLTLDYAIEAASGRSVARIDPCCINILRMGAYQLYYMVGVHSGAAVNESVKLAKKTKKAYLSGFVNAVLRRLAAEGDRLLPPPDELSAYYSCSPEIVASFTADYGEATAKRLLEASLCKADTVLRVNNTRITDEELLTRLAAEGYSCELVREHYIRLDGGSPTASELYANGFFHMQSLASAECVAAVAAASGELVLDACAAPGGKAFSIAECMGNTGEVVALELHPHRAELIKAGAERLGLSAVRASAADAAGYTGDGRKFDRILCDVPCSGLGMLSEKPDIKYRRPDEGGYLSELQYSILKNCSSLLKRGGRLVYSTCTLRRAENENVVERFLKENGDFELKSQKTYMPHIDGLSGFFVAVLERRA